jgi:uncharacterized lipoprotein YddW (UPF0748 family)
MCLTLDITATRVYHIQSLADTGQPKLIRVGMELIATNWRKLLMLAVVAVMALSPLMSLFRTEQARTATQTPTTSPSSTRTTTSASGGAQLKPAATATAALPPAQAQTDTTAATAQPAAQRETRALWVSRWDLKDAPSVQYVVDRAASAHFNTILFQVRGQADALYPSQIEPWASDLTGTFGKNPGYDPLADLITAAHAKGIQVQAWLNVYPAWMGATPPPADVKPTPMYQDFNARFGNEWLQWPGGKPMALGGESYLAANPAHPAVQQRVVDVCKDLLSRYQLDGLHLDYIRYSDPQLSKDPVSNQAYAAAVAKSPGLSREDWQRDQVTALVTRVRNEALPLRPGARLTTSAWPVYQDRWGWYSGKGGYNAYYQDSQGWAKKGTADAIFPMLYGVTLKGHLDRYETLAQDYVQGAAPGRVVLGIGGDEGSFSALSDRIAVARKLGAAGEAFFSYRALETNGYWTQLANGPYHDPAVPNW